MEKIKADNGKIWVFTSKAEELSIEHGSVGLDLHKIGAPIHNGMDIIAEYAPIEWVRDGLVEQVKYTEYHHTYIHTWNDFYNSLDNVFIIINMERSPSQYYQISKIPYYPRITDGVARLMKITDCYWFFDIIGSHQKNQKLNPEFQEWKFEFTHESRLDYSILEFPFVKGQKPIVLGSNNTRNNLKERTVVIKGGNNSNCNVVREEITYANRYIQSVKVYLVKGILYLPSECTSVNYADVTHWNLSIDSYKTLVAKVFYTDKCTFQDRTEIVKGVAVYNLQKYFGNNSYCHFFKHMKDLINS